MGIDEFSRFDLIVQEFTSNPFEVVFPGYREHSLPFAQPLKVPTRTVPSSELPAPAPDNDSSFVLIIVVVILSILAVALLILVVLVLARRKEKGTKQTEAESTSTHGAEYGSVEIGPESGYSSISPAFAGHQTQQETAYSAMPTSAR